MLPGWVDVDDMDKKLVPYYRKQNVLFSFLPLYSLWGSVIPAWRHYSCRWFLFWQKSED